MITKLPDRFIPPLAFLVALLLCYFCYQLGFGAPFRFDDFPNLEGLSKVDGWDGAIAYVFGGNASSYGRPLALASFLLNAHSWPSVPEDFFYFNTCLHLINGALIAGFALQLLRVTRGFKGLVEQRFWSLLAVASSALWLLNPLLLSTSLIAVQRMTLLSATFVLATLIAYLAVRQRWIGHGGGWLGGVGLAAILAVGGGVAMLSKETAINLLIYVALIEYFLLVRTDDLWSLRLFRWICLLLPAVLLIAYVALNWRGFMVTFAMRDFSVEERLLSAPRILADYLSRGLIPLPSQMGPYHDDFVISRDWLTPLTTIWAFAFWVLLGGGAMLLRRHWPLIPFCVFWFLCGHFLEAGPFGLELYFEHRNYLPLFGPMLLISTAPFFVPIAFRRVGASLVGVFGLLLLSGLVQSASLWGQPFVSAEVWSQAHPMSLRATQFYAQSFYIRGDKGRAAELLAEASSRMPFSAGLILAELQLRCDLPEEKGRLHSLAAKAEALGPNASFEFSVLETLGKINNLFLADSCPGLLADDLLAVSAALLDNKKYQSRREAVGALHYQRGRLYLSQRSFAATIREFDAAYRADPDIETIALLTVLLWDAGQLDEAEKYLRLARENLPENNALKKQWLDKLTSLELMVSKH